MSANIEVKWHKPIPQIVNDATGGARTMRFAAVTWHRLYRKFVPMDTGSLADNVAYNATATRGTIRHVVPYANRQYNGTNHNFRRHRNALASARWDQAAIAAGMRDKLARDVQAYVRRG